MELQSEEAEALLTISKNYAKRYFPSRVRVFHLLHSKDTKEVFSARLKEVLKDLVFIPGYLRCTIPLSSYRKHAKHKTPLPVAPSVNIHS